MFRYFNLNLRGSGGSAERPGAELKAPGVTSSASVSVMKQVLMYAGVLLGVLFSSAIDQYKTSGTVTLQISPATALVSAVIAMMLMPIAYDKLSVRRNAPFLVQLGLFVQNGVFWHVLISSAGKAISPASA